MPRCIDAFSFLSPEQPPRIKSKVVYCVLSSEFPFILQYHSYPNKGTFNSQASSPYYAFVFARCVVAENPSEGNAIYVVTGLESWQSLLKLSKEVLNRLYPNRVRKIVHRGNWKGRLEESLLSSS